MTKSSNAFASQGLVWVQEKKEGKWRKSKKAKCARDWVGGLSCDVSGIRRYFCPLVYSEYSILDLYLTIQVLAWYFLVCIYSPLYYLSNNTHLLNSFTQHTHNHLTTPVTVDIV